MNPYEELGLAPDASPEEVKRAYRKRARSTHPDKGGSTEKFQVVQHAYEVLRDPARRKQFDDHGTIDPRMPEDKARMEAVGIVSQIIEQSENPESLDVIEEAKKQVRAGQNKIRAHIKSCERKSKKYKSIAARFRRKSKKPGTNLFSDVFAQRSRDMLKEIEVAKSKIEEGEKIIAVLDDFSFEREELVSTYHSIFVRYPGAGSGGGGSFHL